MAVTWDEIKRLAADFQRAQLSITTQRLAERNCHELICKLTSLGLIDVIHTCDGKTYLTPEELCKEIRDEVVVQSGRVNLVTIQQSLNVDMIHIERKVHEMVAQDSDLQLVLGQIIHSSYLEQLARDVNDQLQEQGQITFANLTKEYDLPGDFLKNEILKRLGSMVFGKVDPNNKDVLYTDAYISRHKCRVRGIFSALTRPIALSSILTRYQIPERLLYGLMEELISTGRLKGSLSSNKTSYSPDIYTNSQKVWVLNFYESNGYLEYDSLTRLGVADPKNYIKKSFKDVIMLNACCVSEACLESLDVAIEECVASNTYMDVMTILPSAVSVLDASQLLQMSLKSHKQAVVLGDTIVTTQQFINSCVAPFEDLMENKATADMKMNASVFADAADKKTLMTSGGDDSALSRKEERRKRAAGATKAGGGTQGREVKSKAVKSKFKGRGKDSEEEDEEETSSTYQSKARLLEFMSIEKISEVIGKLPQLENCSAMLVTEIAERLYRPLKDKYQDVAKSVYMRSVGGGQNASKKKQQGEFEEKVNGLYSNIKLFEKGIKAVDDLDLQTSLSKHLLKTVCTELANCVVQVLAVDHMISVAEGALDSPEGRAKIISNLPDEVKVIAGKVHTSLAGKSIEAFDDAINELLSPKIVGVLLRKLDKKKERQLMFNHRQSLLEQLRSESDIPTSFHLAIIIIFGTVFQAMLHCSGRMVPQIVALLKVHLTEEEHLLLSQCQDLIIDHVKKEGEPSEELVSAAKKVHELAKSLKKCISKSDE